jgi:hypothetical protein
MNAPTRLSALLCSTLAASCGTAGLLGPGPLLLEKVRVSLPELPAVWEGLGEPSFTLGWRDAEGRPRSMPARPGASLRLELPRGMEQPLLFSGEAGGIPLLPAGASFPAARAPGREAAVALSWEGGWSATVEALLEGAGLAADRYDLGLLGALARERLGDPWLLDPREAARRLAAGSMRLSWLSMPELQPVELPSPGPWFPESALAAAPRPLPGGSWEALLPPGLSRFVGRGLELLVLRGEGEPLVLVRSRPAPTRAR